MKQRRWKSLGQAALLAVVAGQAWAVDVPELIRVPPGQQLLFKTAARGVQVYACRQQGTDYGWELLAPDAVLYTETGAKAGRHYAGPTWEGLDGSQVVGQLQAKFPVAGAVPWLLVSAKSVAGQGAFAPVEYINRLETTGGLPPAGGCDASHQDALSRSPYTAHYYFYGSR